MAEFILDRAFVRFPEDTPTAIEQYRALDEREDIAVLKEVLEAIFGAPAAPRSEETVLKVVSYVGQVLTPGQPKAQTGSDFLKAGQAACGGKSRALVSLCRLLGFPAREVMAHNIGTNINTHVMVEVHYDGSWHLVDPLQAAFFYSKKSFDKGGHVLSFREILTETHLLENAFQLDVPRATGRYVPTSTVVAYKDAERLENYRRVFTDSFPMALTEKDKRAVSYPLEVDFALGADLWFGGLDEDYGDIAVRDDADRWKRYRGFITLGKYKSRATFHTVIFRVPRPGKCRLTYHFVADSARRDLGVVELKGVFVTNITATVKSWSMECNVRETEGIVLVFNRSPELSGRESRIDAIRAEFLGEAFLDSGAGQRP